MKTLVAMLLALGLAASAVPAFAEDEPTDQASCEDQGMIWDAEMGTCYPAD
jgi:hypothetical protein